MSTVANGSVSDQSFASSFVSEVEDSGVSYTTEDIDVVLDGLENEEPILQRTPKEGQSSLKKRKSEPKSKTKTRSRDKFLRSYLRSKILCPQMRGLVVSMINLKRKNAKCEDSIPLLESRDYEMATEDDAPVKSSLSSPPPASEPFRRFSPSRQPLRRSPTTRQARKMCPLINARRASQHENLDVNTSEDIVKGFHNAVQ